MTQLFSNNAVATLLSGITNVATSMVISSGSEVLFPTISSPSDFFIVTLESDELFEIVKVTATSANTFTIIRAQEGTTARAWPAGTVVELRLTAGGIQKIQADIGSGGVVNLGLGSTVDGNPIWHAGNDGTGSGLDADLLDGQHATAFAQANNAVLTGVPTAPTATVDTNTTQIATTAFVLGQKTATTPLMNGVATVGTETRWAAGNHVHPTDTSRAPLLSPTFTGTPSAPTAAVNTNTTQIATTAFVVGQKGSSSPLMNGVAASGSSLRYSSEDHVHPSDTTKLDASQYTASDILTKIKTVDGTGSGLDADTLDGLQSSAFPTLSGNNTFTGSQTISSTLPLLIFNETDQVLPAGRWRLDVASDTFRILKNTAVAGDFSTANIPISIGPTGTTVTFNSTPQVSGNNIWHEANDGAGSGLDADTLDGLQGSAFAQLTGANFSGAISGTSVTLTDRLTVSSTTPVIDLSESDQVADSRLTRLAINGGTISLSSRTDAGVFQNNLLTIARATGNTTILGTLSSGAFTSSANVQCTGLIVRNNGTTNSNITSAADAQQCNLNFATADVNMWSLTKTATANSGSNTGSDFEILSRNDAGSGLSNVLSIKRSTGNIIIAGTAVSDDGANKLQVNGSAKMSGVITSTSGQIFCDNVNGGGFYSRAGASGQGANFIFSTGTSNRWILTKNSTAETGSNAGSDFSLLSRDDSGNSLGTVIFAKRSNGNVVIGAGTENGYKLEVNGTFNATSTITQNGTAVSLTGHTHSAADITSGTLAVARGGTGVTTSTGSGSVVLSTSPTLVTPVLGTPSSGTLTNCTGLPIVAGTTGTLSVARGGTGTTTSTGSGSVVLNTSPSFSGAPLVPDYAATSRRASWTPAYLTIGATGNFTTAHLGNIVDLASGITVTIPSGLGGTSGEIIQVISMSNTTTISPGAGVTLTWLQGTTSSTGSRTLGAKAVVTLVKRSVGTDDWIIYGNGIS